ncbi:MAG: vanadium-dependent haloperoxidase [Saprospiraceae bacterium]
MKFPKILLFALVLVLAWGCQEDMQLEQDPSQVSVFKYNQVKPANQYKPELAQQWMQMAYNSVKARGFFALDASRLYAYTSLVMYESMVHGIPKGLSMEGQLKSFSQVPKPAENLKYDWGIVLCHATPIVLNYMLQKPNTAIVSDIVNLEKSQERLLIEESKLSSDVIANSKAFGAALADHIIKFADSDGTLELSTRRYTMPSTSVNPAFYDGIEQATPFFMMPFWWTARSFVIPAATTCKPLPPYTYSEDPASRYYQDVLEVLDATKDKDKVDIGYYWANNPGQSGTPAGAWVGIGNQLVNQFKLDLEATLKMYLLLTLSTRDTFIAVWWTKYNWNLQRPVSYIRRVLKQPNWNSPVPTPPYPDYVSGTSANAGSSSEILTALFGTRSFTDAQHSDKGFGVQTFSSFKRAGFEAYHSRIYGGVHMRKACEEGFKLGECVGRELLSKLNFTTP